MPEPAAPVEQLPSAGGSYIRHADGSLQCVDDTGPATQPEAAAQAHTQDPQE